MRFLNTTCLSAPDTTSQTSAALDTSQWFSASFHAYFGDATAAGTLKIQASNDPTNQFGQPVSFVPTNWVDITSATATITLGGAALIQLPQVAYRWLRVVYTRSSGGSTTINVNVMGLSS